MGKSFRIILFITLILIPIIFYNSFNRKENSREVFLPTAKEKTSYHRPKVALIFDDLGESLKELKTLYTLDIPVTVSIIPGLKFSKNIAYIGSRCGFSIFIHLPLQPKGVSDYKTDKYKFIGGGLNKREVDSLLRYYLNHIRVAIGVNNHMGSAATEDPKLMNQVLKAVKRKGLIFVDSFTSLESVAYDTAKKLDLVCAVNDGFLDSVDDVEAINKKLDKLVKKAKEKGRIIVIAHPKENTFKVLRERLPQLKKHVEFVNMKDYFEL
jgi:polysaccharide deacetylase 2 family uncharacterized protein YibQ